MTATDNSPSQQTAAASLLQFYVNGSPVQVHNPAPDCTLIQFLRTHLSLTGTKLGCAEGGCGACTVLVSELMPDGHSIEHCAVNACLAPLCSMEGRHVITVEGLGTSKDPHPVQERIAKLFGSQCGFCTPGIVMSLYALLRNNPTPTDHDIEDAFDGNLCRCTGYRPILDAAKSFSVSAGSGCCGGAAGKTSSGCCRSTNKDSCDIPINAGTSTVQVKKYDPSQELIFPPALINRLRNGASQLQVFVNGDSTWYRPVTLSQLLELKNKHSDAKIICGNTEVGIETKFKHTRHTMLIYPMHTVELCTVTTTDAGIEFGACLTLTRFIRALKSAIKSHQPHEVRNFAALLENLRWFAGGQIRNVATIAGNIVTASPISDLNPIFIAANCVLCVQSQTRGVRQIRMQDFFLGYRKTALASDEVLMSIFVPFTRQSEFTFAFKQAKRRDDDIAIVTAGMRVWLDGDISADKQMTIKELQLGFGGVAPITISASKVAAMSVGQPWTQQWMESAAALLTSQDAFIPASAPGGMVEYRRALAASFLFKFFLKVNKLILGGVDGDCNSACHEKSRPVSIGTQVMLETRQSGAVGKNLMHTSALKQVTGEAQYTDDMPRLAQELYAGLVMSTATHATIKNIDATVALSQPGVHGFVSASDLSGGENIIGPVFKDEELFATKTVHHAGQMLGVVLADTQAQAQHAARLVRVEYEQHLPAIVTIPQAIAANSFFPAEKHMERGDVNDALQAADMTVQGEIQIGGQEHFYLETNASLVIPKREDDEVEIWASTQNPTETQHLVAHVLGVPSHKVVCKVKRLGGGFGGKETKSVALTCALAVAAKKYRRPVRCMLDRDEDMILSGQRHPFLGRYKVGFSKAGLITAVDVELFSNAGYSADLSIAVMERAVAHSDNCYWLPNIRVHGRVCKTNLHSNTAFRGFGGPQGMFITETWMTHVAEHLGRAVEELREVNTYREGQMTHFNQPLENFYVPRIWAELKQKADWTGRRAAIEAFNSANRYKKRGLAMLPTKFGIAYTARFLNQAGALVHVYTDGSVLLTHGGTEMGQGLHTKCIQICADELGVPTSQVHLSETSTDKVANTSPTAASASSDLNGMAVLLACRQIKDRLQPYLAKGAVFNDAVRQAYFDRVNLSANGFYRTPDLDYSWEKNCGRLFNYFTFGVAIAEVEIDVLTGDSQTLRADVMMDLGTSLNPAIDIGQIEGAFVQGLGWCTMEETLFTPTGQLITRGPGTYKIPGFTDIPIDFRVSLLADVENPRAVHSSKAVGEPPFFLGASVYFAMRDAIRHARDSSEYFRLDSPATAERVRMHCADMFTRLAASIPRKPGEQDWSIRV